MTFQPLANISIDLDNKWAYLKAKGDEAWESFPSYFDLVVPRILEFLDEHRLKATFFIVGQDAALAENRHALEAIVENGHEIANHSFHHEPWLHTYSSEKLLEEIVSAESAIKSVTGKCPKGFRGPGFSMTPELLKILMRRGYTYDATTFPTFIGPLARMYYFLTSSFTADQKKDRRKLFGDWWQGLGTLYPFQWKSAERRLVEIPVTTMPVFKLPIHGTYLLYLAQFSTMLARVYFSTAMMLCRIFKVEPSFLLHPLDFIGQNDGQGLEFFPGMKQPAQQKIELLGECVSKLNRHFQLVEMQTYAEALVKRNLKEYPLKMESNSSADCLV